MAASSSASSASTMVYEIKGMSEYARLQDHATYQPTEVGNFSISEDGDLINCNMAKIPTLKSFQLPLNLNEGYRPKTPTVDDLRESHFPQWEKGLKWIRGSENGYQSLSDVDVVTDTEALREIGYTNHNFYKTPWKYGVCKFNGTMYIRKVEGEEANKDAWAVKSSYWDKKFEEFVIEQEPGTKATYKVLKGNIGVRKVLLSTEVGAVTSDGKEMEVKTCFANKLTGKIPSSWLQSHLGDIDVLYYGLKNKRGIVSDPPTEISTAQVPGRFLKAYEANSMVGFLGDILDWTCSVLPDGDETWELEHTGLREIVLNYKGVKFLPEWYSKWWK